VEPLTPHKMWQGMNNTGQTSTCIYHQFAKPVVVFK
jgi:hypothetical protein